MTPPTHYFVQGTATNAGANHNVPQLNADKETPEKSTTTEEDGANSSCTMDEEMDNSSTAAQQSMEGSNGYEEEMDESNTESLISETDEDAYPPTDEFETPPESVIDESVDDEATIVRRSPRTKGGATRNRRNYNLQDDYRRFSARSKKKTTFFGISHQNSKRKGGGFRNHQKFLPVQSKRALKFDRKNDLLLVNKVPHPMTKQSFVPPPSAATASPPKKKPSQVKLYTG